jgi:hypothetical protein
MKHHVKTDQSRAVLAFLMAPMMAPFLWWALLLARGQSGATGPLEALGGLELIILVAIPFAYGAAFGIGLPVYLIIQRWSKLRAWHTVLFGAAVGAVVFPLTDRLPVDSEEILTGVALGTAVGLTFWWLYRPHRTTRD